MELECGSLLRCFRGAANVNLFDKKIFSFGYEAFFHEGVHRNVAFLANFGTVGEKLANRNAFHVPGCTGKGKRDSLVEGLGGALKNDFSGFYKFLGDVGRLLKERNDTLPWGAVRGNFSKRICGYALGCDTGPH